MATVKVDLAPTDEEGSVSSDTEKRARGLTHAVLMSRKDAELCKDESEDDSYSYTSVKPVKCNDMLYPPRGLAHYDHSSLSCGFFVHYDHFIDVATDVFQETKCLETQAKCEGLTPNFHVILDWVITQLRLNPNMAKCQTLVILSDTRKLEDIPHWKHTARWIVERTRWKGPDQDAWYAFYVPSGQFNCHFVWTAVYILKALVAFLPDTDLVLFDHDAAFTTLFENKQLSSMALNCHLPFRYNITHVGCLTITEPWSPANAGIVWFPRRKPNLGNEPQFDQAKVWLNSISSKHLTGKARKAVISEVINHLDTLQKALVNRKKRLPSIPEDKPWSPPHNSLEEDSPETLRMQTGLDWNLEAEFSVLNSTPLHRSEAISRDDLIIGWALLGDFMHVMFFPRMHLTTRDGTRGNLDEHLQKRAPSLAGWAGPGFEQTCLQSLFVLQSATAGVISLPGEKLFMAQYMPGDEQTFMPPIMYHGYGGAKDSIKHLDKFLFWFTIGEALAPFRKQDGGTMLPYMMSPQGFFPDMGVKLLVEKLPEVGTTVRTLLDQGWTCGERNVCPSIQASLTSLGMLRPIIRVPGSQASSTPLNSLVETASLQTKPAASQPSDSAEANVGQSELEARAKTRETVVISCPGLRGTKIENVCPHISILNPAGLTAYGPTGKRAEDFSDDRYLLPFYPAPTLHGLMLVFGTDAAVGIWNAIEQKVLTKSKVVPLPSWWHLPSEAVTMALALLLLQYGTNPPQSVDLLLQPQLACRDSSMPQDGTPVRIYGFSAGSYSGIFAYRILTEKGHALKCSFDSGILGAICFHPILLYDFFLRKNDSPIKSANQGVGYKAGQGTQLKRPALLHCTDDALCLWKPTNEEVDGLKQLGFPVKLIRLNKHLKKTSQPFGRHHHNYSKLLVPILNKSEDAVLDELGLPQLLELANFSTDGDQFFGVLLSIVGVVTLKAFGSLMLRLASVDPTHLLREQLTTSIAEVEPEEQITLPGQLFWHLLRCQVAENDDALIALSLLKPFFFEKLNKLESAHQRWLLFFALPGALARHTDDAKVSSANLTSMDCQTPRISATSLLEATSGDLSFKLSFHISKDDAETGWGIFLRPEAEYFDFEHHLSKHIEELESAWDPTASFSRQSKAPPPKLPLPRGVSLGLRIGDLASFSMSWPSLSNTEPLQVWAVVHNKTIHSSQEEYRAGAIPHHKINSLQMVISLVPPMRGKHQDRALETILRAICTSRHLDFNSLVESTLVENQVRAEHHSLLKAAGKLLIQHMNDNPAVILSGWTLVESKFAPMEWASLLNLNKELHPLLLQPDTSALLVEPAQALKRERAPLFALLDHALAQLRKEFINYDGDEIHLDRILETTGLHTSSLSFIELTDLVEKNFKYRQNVNLIAQPGVCENIWYVLALISPRFANDFAKAMYDKQKVTLAFLTHVELHLHYGRKACFVQGLFGAGKTFTTGMLAFLSGTILAQRMLWTSHNNKPLEEASKILSKWACCSPQDSIKESVPLLFKRICALSVPTKHDLIDVSAKDLNSLDGDFLRVLILTTSVLADRFLQTRFVGATFAKKADLLAFDEAQQFGSATDAWLLSVLPPSTLLIFLGDQAQPCGAGNSKLQQRVHELLRLNKPCLFSDFCKPLVPRKYLTRVHLVDENGCKVTPVTDFSQLIRKLTSGCRLTPPVDLAEWLGFSTPGALLLPVSVRVPHTVYQSVGFIAYAEQLVHSTYEPVDRRLVEPQRRATPLLEDGLIMEKTEDSDLEVGSASSSDDHPSLTELPIPSLQPDKNLTFKHVCLVDIGMPNTLRTLPLVIRGLCVPKNLESTLGEIAVPPERAVLASAEHDDAIATFANEEDIPDEDIHLVNSPLRVGTYLLEYNNCNARSSARSSSNYDLEAQQKWLEDALSTTLDAFAVMTYLSLIPSHEHNFNLGFLCPWRCLNDKIAGHFSANNLERTKNNRKTTTFNSLVEAIASLCKLEWGQLTLQDIRWALQSKPQHLASFFTIGTSISSASANVRHSVVFIPRHTKFTGEFEQSVVACTRATGFTLLICPLACRSGFFKTYIPLVCQLRGMLRLSGEVSTNSLAGAILESAPQPALPWEIPTMLGLTVSKDLDFAQRPFGLIARIQDEDGSFTDATMHLMISAAHVTVDLPTWVMATDRKMFCWRQTSPAAIAPSSTPSAGFLLQFSLKTRKPLLTLYFVKGLHRKIISATSTFRFKCGIAQFENNYTQLKVSLRQAFAEEILFGFARVAVPDASANSDAIVNAIENADASLLETHVDAHAHSDEEEDTPGGDKAADNDAEASENVEAVERLKSFLDGTDRTKATPQMLTALAIDPTPFCWGSIRLETFSAYINTLAVLSTSTVLASRDVPLDAQAPTFAQLEKGYITFLAELLTSVLSCLRQHPTLVEQFPTLLGHLSQSGFWSLQIRHALDKGYESALPPHRLLRLLPVRKWNHLQVPWMFRLDPNAGYFIPDSAIIYLPIQLCIWVAAYLKQASPDPPDDAARTVRAPVVIDSTPLLGELSVLPCSIPDKKSEQEAKGVKRSVDSAPKASTVREVPRPPEEDVRVLKRFLQVGGPALRPYEPWATSEQSQAFLKAFAKKHADASDTSDFSPTTIMKYFDLQRELKIGITISKVPHMPDTNPVLQLPSGAQADKDLEQMYGSGHTADLKRLMQVFNAPAAVNLLRSEKPSLMYEQRLIHEVWNNFTYALKKGPPEEKYSVRKPSCDRAQPKARSSTSSASRRPPEPSRPPTSTTAASSHSEEWQAWTTSSWNRDWSSWSNWRSW